MYDEKKDIFVEDFLADINEAPFIGDTIPGINSPQINSDISIET